ncbi:MAG: TetR/AcrR family transcriptional regulator [Propionibacteriaceae bacterium]|jgi:AcrR family transcriptional regulator|nr:TetR/AcrR family transcriptional regulator [Propionibacteriaceae bacterium]
MGGLRERKKQQTLLALHRAALRLTLEAGLEATTVGAIAEAADVSPRTFFNYFAAKEDAVIGFSEQFMTGLIDAFADDPEPPADIVAALVEVIWTLMTDATALGSSADDRQAVIERNPALLRHVFASVASIETRLIDACARRLRCDPRFPDDDARLDAARVGVSVAVGIMKVTLARAFTPPAGGSSPGALASPSGDDAPPTRPQHGDASAPGDAESPSPLPDPPTWQDAAQARDTYLRTLRRLLE